MDTNQPINPCCAEDCKMHQQCIATCVLVFRQTSTILFLKINDKRVSETNKLSVSLLKKNLLNQKKNELFNLYSQSHISKLKNSILIEYR